MIVNRIDNASHNNQKTFGGLSQVLRLFFLHEFDVNAIFKCH